MTVNKRIKIEEGELSQFSGNMSQDERLGASSDINRISPCPLDHAPSNEMDSWTRNFIGSDFQRVELIIIIFIVIEEYLEPLLGRLLDDGRYMSRFFSDVNIPQRRINKPSWKFNLSTGEKYVSV
ncbi:hypothetical protein CDAR_400191 [Caerostris darwini]|uniref:Maturase K n=1 Tax=Caerostris darwini TaxID=1538125 RepID=A0AAV4SBR3_9ARAC|nr:hypothetical protein CDAR_400191 [Caerostris darwini]